MRVFDKLISIQRINEATEQWEDVYKLHAYINKPNKNSEYLDAGAVQAKRTLTFEVRYFKDLEDVANNTQLYRIMYNGIAYNIIDYDDFALKHKNVKMVGVSY